MVLLESEKSREHEAPLTGLDYNRKLGLVVSSCSEGVITIWTFNKKFMREILFPHRIDSVCFYNAEGDILVSHEKRISMILFKRYKIAAFNYILTHQDHIKRKIATDELFEELKDRDDEVRGKKPPAD